MESQSLGKGSKIGATAIIWGFATGMLAICIPLVSITKSGFILPLVVVLGASGSTAVVWLSSGESTRKISELTDSIRALEQRVINLETIGNTDEFPLPKKVEYTHSQQKMTEA